MIIYCSSKAPYLYSYRNKSILLICDSYVFLSSHFSNCKLSEVTELYCYFQTFKGNTLKLDLRYTNVRNIRLRNGPGGGTFKSTLENAITYYKEKRS